MIHVPSALRTAIGGLVFVWLGSMSLGDEIVLPSQPVPSPDGKTLAFAWRGDVWTAPIEGGRARRLTTHPARDAQPKFSPDGRRIAFTSDRGAGTQVFVVAADGGEPVALTAHSAGYALEGWYPDCEHLLVSGVRDHFWRRGERLFRIRAAEKPAERGAEELLFDDYATEAAVSPDGKRVLYVREGVAWWRKGYVGSQDAQIWMFDLTTKKHSKLLDLPGGCRWPLWKPTGDGFYFVSAESGTTNLWRYDFATKQRTQLTRFDDDGVVFPAVSRDGSTIVFRRLFDLYRLEPGKNESAQKIRLTAEADDAPDSPKRVTHGKATEAAFTADGLEIAFVAGGDVWVMDTELREPKQVTDTPEEERHVTFAPDGESLYFVSDRGGQADVWRARRGDVKRFWWRNDAFPVERLTNDADVESDLKFRPDGARLAYVRGNGDLWTMAADGKDARRVFASWDEPEYQWSPDGRWFAYAVFDEDFNRDVWIRPADGSGAPFNVSRHPDNDGAPVWSPDGKLLAFVGRRRLEESDIHYVWLRKHDDEIGTRERTVEAALEKIQKARKKPTAAATPTGANVKGAVTGTAGAAATPTSAAPAATKPPAVAIDFDDLHRRVRSIPIDDAEESELVWAPDSKRLAFVAEIKGQRGLYAVSFPSPAAPALVTTDVGSSPRWLAEGNQIAWLAQGVPASVSSAGKQTTYRFTVRQTVDVAAKYRAAFDLCWRTMRDRWYDERLGNRNWDAIRRKYSDAAAAAIDDVAFATVVSLMLGELNGSHLGFTPSSLAKSPDPATWPIVTAHLGVRFDPAHKGPGLKIRDVVERGPADQVRSRLFAGETILAIDGTAVDPARDLTAILNGPPSREFTLRVKNVQGAERDVVVRSISYDAVPQLLYEQWVRANRRFVETASKGTLAYVHIAGMNEPSLLRFEEELYSAASGKSGLVIDVRENGGGYTTDHLLTMLTQPRHAITVPRGGTPGYPQDRKIYATWNKPIVVLCNQNSFSNAEIFSHAIKTLGRGKLVGVPTAGGVVSTGAAQIMDVGMLRLPTRGWYVPTTGEDMELNGAQPDVVIRPEPGQMPAGKDVQLEKAVEVLAADVRQWQSRPQPKLRKATERGDK